jgi:hypothetical protein
MRECGAKTRSGGRCKGQPMPNGRCRMHGGASLSGIASPTFQTGRYSKYLPAHLLADFQSAQADPTLVECRDELALIDSRLGQLAQRFQSGKDAELWAVLSMSFDTLATSFDALLSAVEPEGDEAETAVREATGALEGCRSVIHEVRASESTWREVYGVLEQRRKLVETESKRLKDMQQLITVERAMGLIAALADSVRRNVTDRKQLAAIQSDLIRLTTGAANQEAVAA